MSQLTPIYTPKNIIIILLVAVLLYLVMCNRPVTPDEKPEVKSVKEQADAVKVDSIASAHFKDSVNKIVNYWQQQSNHWENNWNREVQDNADLQKTVSDVLNSSVPDTCEQYKKKVITEFNKLVLSSAKKDTSCSKALAAYRNVVSQKDVLIKKGKEDYTKLKINFDTALAQQSKLQKYIDKVKPKREISLLVSTIFDYRDFKPDVGVGIGYRTKKGIELNLAVYTNQQAAITLKKPLFKF